MFFFLLLGVFELIGAVLIYSAFQTYIMGPIRKRKYPISKETTVLLTGAAMGPGKHLALEFARTNKCTVIVYDIREDLITPVMSEIAAVGAKGWFFKCDVSDESEVTRVVESTLEKFHHIDIVINCVGISNLKLLTEVSFADFSKAISVTFLSAVSIIKKIIPSMIKRNQGHIVNISSIASILPSLKMTDYCASKAALSGFHNALRLELKQQKRNISTTLVCPYAVNTGILQGIETSMKSLFPILDEVTVAKVIYNSILEQREEVFIPQIWKHGALFLRALPTAVIDWLTLKYLGKIGQTLVGKNAKKSD